MKKRQIISSLLVSGILLTNVSQALAETQLGEQEVNTSVNNETNTVQESVNNANVGFQNNGDKSNMGTLQSNSNNKQVVDEQAKENESDKDSNQSIIVNTLDELKSALINDNGVTDISLGADISLTEGIRVNPNKKNVTIDGAGHRLSESNILRGPHGTIYIDDQNGTKEVTIKNIIIDGKDFYGPVAVDFGVNNVVLNYEDVTYKGPQLVYNVHGFAKFSGVNNIDIVTNGDYSDPGQEIAESAGVEISGDFKATHEGQVDSAFWFGVGTTANPYLKISDSANVSINVLYNTMFYVDRSIPLPLDIAIGKNAKLDVQTKRELFRFGRPGNIDLSNGSTMSITRSGSLNTLSTFNLNGSNLNVSPNANLIVKHSPETLAPIFALQNQSTINFDSAESVDLQTSSKSHIFAAGSVNSSININTKTMQAWHESDNYDADYREANPLTAKLSIDGWGGYSLLSSNHPDLLSNWNVKKTNRLLLNGKVNTEPVITAEDKTLKVGASFDPKLGVTAQDAEDGDLTSKIQVKSNDVDTSKAGTYHVTYSVTDNDGNTTEKTITILVESNSLPKITAEDKTLKVGASFDPKLGVTAQDAEDGDLTSKIQVKSNDVDTSKAGTYHVTYSVTDNDGNTTEKTITILVESNSLPKITVEDKTLKVGASFDPKLGVTAQDAEDGDLTSKIQVKSNDVDTSKAGTYHVTYSVTDNDGNTTEKTITVKVEAVVGTVTPTSYDLSGSRSLTGTYSGDVVKIKVEINGTVQPAGGTVSGGKFSYYTGSKITKSTDKVYVIGLDHSGKELDRKQVTITNSNTSGTVTPTNYDLSGSRSLTGTYSGDVVKIRVEINGTVQPAGGTVSGGKFSYYTGSKITKSTDKVYVIGLDHSGKELDRKQVTVTNSKTSGTVTPTNYDLSGSRSLTGTYSGDVVKIKVEINGTVQPAGGTVSGGKFSYYTGSKITKSTDKVYVIGLDHSGKELDRKQVTVTNSKTSGTVTPTNYDLSGSRSLTGTYSGDVVKIKVEINGTVQPAGGTVSGGKFSYYTGSKITKSTDKVYVIGLDHSGKELDRKQVTITALTANGEVKPDIYNISKARSLTGTYSGDVVKIKVEINGTVQPAGGTVSGGKFSYYTGSKITKSTDKVSIIGLNNSGQKLDEKQVKIVLK